MKKIVSFFLPALVLTACAKHDPILPGDRVSVFGDELVIQNRDVPRNVLATAHAAGFTPMTADSNYKQSSDNIITDAGGRKVFSGFPTTAHVSGARDVISHNGYIYAGLSTGEVVKVAPKSRDLKWAADIFKTTAITGGSEIMDIVAPIVIDGKSVYAGGLGGAFCKINDATGAKTWCNWIGVSSPFSIYGTLAFVIGTDGYLYVIDTASGDIYNRYATKCSGVPELVTADGDYFVKCSGKKTEKIKI